MFFSLLVSGCATKSEQIFNKSLPKFINESGNNISTIKFSDNEKYESEKAVPFKREPIICKNGHAYSASNKKGEWSNVSLKSNNDIAVTVIISWTNTGWSKTCYPFVSFKPEENTNYVVVNKRIGGKGWSSMWTGIGSQSCKVSVFAETNDKIVRIKTNKPPTGICGDLLK